MATQQAETSRLDFGPPDVDTVPATQQENDSENPDRYPSNALLPHEGVMPASSKERESARDPPIVGETALHDTEMQNTSELHSSSHLGTSSTSTLAESVSSADIDELEEDQLSSNGPPTPATALADLSRSQGSSVQASAPMSSTPSSTMTSSSSSVVAASEPVKVVVSPHQEGMAIGPVPSASAFIQKDPTISQVPKRQRIPRACDSCRRKKIRCNLSTANAAEPDKAQVCANCHQSGINCTFTKSPAKRGPNKGYIQQLETRLAALESSVSSDAPGDLGEATSEATLSRTARTHGLLPPASTDHVPQYAAPLQKKARLNELGTPVPQYSPSSQHHLLVPSTSLPFFHRTPTNETWSRTTAPPTLHSSNAFFLSSADPHAIPRQPYTQHSPPAHPSEAANHISSRSALPPISRLLSTLPPPEKQHWQSHQESSYADARASSSSRYGYHQADSEKGFSHSRPEDDGPHRLVRKIPSRHPSYSSTPHYADYVPAKSTTSPRLPPAEYPRDPSLLQLPAQRGPQATFEGARPVRSPSIGSPASLHQSVSDHSPQQQDSRLRWPGGPSPSSSNTSRNNTSLLSQLDKSAVLSLDTPAFRKAVYATPAMRTFSILPPCLLEEGFRGCVHLIKAAHLLSTSSATISYAGDVPDDSQWQSDSSAVIGESMVPIRFDAYGSEVTCREIESLMMCYVDSLRRGKLVAGILGAISGKLAILETRGLPCKRYQAVGILLAVWHTVGYSSRRMYFGTPSTSGPDALYSALDTQDPTILAICIFTYNLDKMCRRYCQSGETYVPPESIEFTRVIAASLPEPLPKPQLRLLSILDAFLLALNFAYNQSLTSLPTIESLERQRHHLHSIVNDADSSDILNLLVGPHVLAMVACATLYCLAACREKGEIESDPDQKQNIRTLERDYLSILDALRNMTTALSATPDASLVNSHPYADGGDMRLLYGQIAKFVQVNLAAAVSSSQKQLSASHFIGNLHSLGYLGTVLAAGQETESGST